MPAIFLIAVVRGIVAAVIGFRNRARAAKPKPMCVGCAFAHIQYGACGRRAISCTFGGGVRPIALDVLYCTDYNSRYVPARPAIGFTGKTAVAE
jgi:hypothetical protein